MSLGICMPIRISPVNNTPTAWQHCSWRYQSHCFFFLFSLGTSVCLDVLAKFNDWEMLIMMFPWKLQHLHTDCQQIPTITYNLSSPSYPSYPLFWIHNSLASAPLGFCCRWTFAIEVRLRASCGLWQMVSIMIVSHGWYGLTIIRHYITLISLISWYIMIGYIWLSNKMH